MRKIFEKHETICCILLIVLYVIINSYCLQNFGMDNYITVAINTVFSIFLIMLVKVLKRMKYYGLVRVTNYKRYLYFIPLVVISTANLWGGINFDNSFSNILLHIMLMVNVGFIEEIIFRGFLFKMIERENLKSAIAISAFTFGIGHIVNLINGNDIILTFIQICYAIAIGYLFVVIFYKSKSLWPCICAHIIFNACSIFSIENEISLYIIPIIIITISIFYATYINKRVEDIVIK